MSAPFVLRQELISKHHELIQMLETEYMNHTNELLKQKSKNEFIVGNAAPIC